MIRDPLGVPPWEDRKVEQGTKVVATKVEPRK